MSKEKKIDELFNFSDSIMKNIKEKFLDLKKEGDFINKKYNLPKKEKDLLIEKLLFNLINQALKNKEKENNIKYTKEEKDKFGKKIIELLIPE